MIAAYNAPFAISYPQSDGAMGAQVLFWALGTLIRGPYLKFLLSLRYGSETWSILSWEFRSTLVCPHPQEFGDAKIMFVFIWLGFEGFDISDKFKMQTGKLKLLTMKTPEEFG